MLPTTAFLNVDRPLGVGAVLRSKRSHQTQHTQLRISLAHAGEAAGTAKALRFASHTVHCKVHILSQQRQATKLFAASRIIKRSVTHAYRSY